MKLHILSDLHLEFKEIDIPDTDSDIVILAGDIHVGKRAINWIKKQFVDKTVLYVLGNHEFYGETLPKHVDKLKELTKGSNIHVLDNDKFIKGDVVFLGCTLWTDFNLFKSQTFASYEASQRMNDYRRIRVSPRYSKLKPIDLIGMHCRSLRWLRGEVLNLKDKKVVVITHHAPSKKSLLSENENNLMYAAYASDLESFIKSSNISTWIHGHLHHSNDYKINNTRIISNPKGYPDERNKDFIPNHIINI